MIPWFHPVLRDHVVCSLCAQSMRARVHIVDSYLQTYSRWRSNGAAPAMLIRITNREDLHVAEYVSMFFQIFFISGDVGYGISASCVCRFELEAQFQLCTLCVPLLTYYIL